MKVAKSTLETVVTYDDAMKNKYLVRKEWDKTKRTALVIMKNAGHADGVFQDQTTMYVVNNLSKLGYGVVEIANLFTTIEGKETKESEIENLKCIKNAVSRVDDIIVAAGKGIETNKKAIDRLKMMLAIFLDAKANILQIETSYGRKGFHPLHPSLKHQWKLIPYEISNI